MIARQLAVIGLGLIGGSAARSLRAAGAVGSIVGYDPDPEQCRQALALGVIDRMASDAADAVHQADVVLLAVPVLRTAEAFASFREALPADCIVTDVGSTKQSVLADIGRVHGSLPPWFVAGHPIAGTEKSGVANSVPALFRNHRVVLTPHAQQSAAALARVTQMWTACGARVVQMQAERHDSIFAATSHLPHVLAYAFVDMVADLDREHDIFPNAGGGFRDFTRIASSSPQMWHDIVKANAAAVGELLARQISELQAMQQMIVDGRWDDLKSRFERARNAREHYLSQIE